MLQMILDSIRRKKQELILTREEQYHKLIRELAQGSEVDAEAAAEILDSVGKDEHHFERDIENQRKRFEYADQLKRKRELEKLLPKLESDFTQANQRYLNEVERLKEMVDAALVPFQSAQSELSTLATIEQTLIQSCRDPRITSRKREIEQRRRQIMEQRQPFYDEEYDAQKRVRYFQSLLEEHNKDRRLGTREEHRKKREELEKTIEHHKSLHHHVAEPLQQLDDELAELAREHEQLDREALTP